MNEAETFLKQAILFLILLLAVFLPIRINFSRNYFIVYVCAVIVFCVFYSSLFFGFRIQSVPETVGNFLSGNVSVTIGSIEINRSLEGFEEKRAQIIEKLKTMGLTKEEIIKKIEPFNDRIVQSYAQQVSRKIKEEVRFLSSQGESETGQNIGTNNEFLTNFRIDPRTLMNMDGVEAAIREMKARDIYSDKIRSEMDKLKSFILNAQILD